MSKKRTKTLSQAIDQLNRIQSYYDRTGRAATGQRIRSRSMDVGGTIGNMADRITMMGGDSMDYRDSRVPLTYEERTQSPTQAEYDAAVKRNQGNPTQRILNARAKAERDLQRNAARAEEREKRTQRANKMFGENRKKNSYQSAMHRAYRKSQGLSAG